MKDAMTDHKAEWVLVPRKLCEAQHLAFYNFHDDDSGRASVSSDDLTEGDRAVTQRQWEAMLAAAPAPIGNTADHIAVLRQMRVELNSCYELDEGSPWALRKAAALDAAIAALAAAPEPFLSGDGGPVSNASEATINSDGIDSKLIGAASEGEDVPYGYTAYGEFRHWCDCDERQRAEWTPVYTRPAAQVAATQPAARRVTDVASVIGHLPAPITNPDDWPPNYADGWNACAQAAIDGLRDSFVAASAPVLVDSTIARHVADRFHGSRYGIDWVYHSDRIGVLSEREAFAAVDMVIGKAVPTDDGWDVAFAPDNETWISIAEADAPCPPELGDVLTVAPPCVVRWSVASLLRGSTGDGNV